MLRAWMRRGVLACLLWPLSLLFGLVANFRFALFVLGYKKSTRLPVPVIVVGNIFLGGTGKTPLVMYLVEQLRRAGWRPGVISRGYLAQQQGQSPSIQEVTADALAAEVGDEPLLIASRCACPLMVGRDRVASAQALLARHPDVNLIIADDGLQHYALQRDIEIMLFDQRGVGNGWLLPAGPLRESVRRRRDFTVFNQSTESDSVDGITQGGALSQDDMAPIPMRLLPGQVYALSDPSHTLTLQEFCLQASTRTVVAAAGIGNPERFFSSLRQAGLGFTGLALSDHHVYQAGSFAQVQADWILITEKDAVKCRQIDALKRDTRIWVLPVNAQLPSSFLPRLLDLLNTKSVASRATSE